MIFTQGPDFVLDKFKALKPARIVVSADENCWPDANLHVRFSFRSIELTMIVFSKVDYPFVESNEKRFINSALIMAYASELYKLLSSEETIPNLQIFMTKTFLDEKTRVNRQKRNDFSI